MKLNAIYITLSKLFFSKSSMKNVNRIGLARHPCCNPIRLWIGSLIVPLHLIHDLTDIYILFNALNKFPFIPLSLSMFRRRGLFIVLKHFFKADKRYKYFSAFVAASYRLLHHNRLCHKIKCRLIPR